MADISQATPSSPQGTASAVPKLPNSFSNFNFENKKFWLIFGGIVAVVLIIIVVFTFVSGRKKEVATQQPPDLAQKAQNQSPVALPAIEVTDQNRQQTNELADYFTRVSPDFKDQFMDNIPEITLDAYKKYNEASAGEVKLEAARAFYIYLNNPGKYKDDESYKLFANDVRDDLEKTLGQPLFAGE